MMRKKIIARLFVKDDLTAAKTLNLSNNQSHYLNNVMRVKIGEIVAVFNGRDGEWLACIDSIRKNACIIVVDHQYRRQDDAADLWLAFAPLKKSRLDFLVEKATELGVSRLLPVFTKHTSIKRINVERLSATVTEAAEQCERLTVPDIDAPLSLDRLGGQWPEDRPLLIAVESGDAQSMPEVLDKLFNKHNRHTLAKISCGILTGPKGGFAQYELDAFDNLPFAHKVGLGPRILRAETAALSALACLQAFIGTWQERPHQQTLTLI